MTLSLARWSRCVGWWALPGLVACAYSKGPEVAGKDYTLLGSYLPPALVEGGVMLGPVTQVYGDKDLSMDDGFIDVSTHTYAFDSGDGHALVHVVGARDYSPFQGFAHVAPDGAVDAVALPDGVGEPAYDPRTTYGTVWVVGAGTSGGAVVAQCYLEVADIVFFAWDTASPESLREVQGDPALCFDGVVGRSGRPDELLLARAGAGSVAIERWVLSAGDLVAAGSTSLPTTATGAVAVFVEEVAPDSFVVVLRAAEGLVRSQTGTADRVVSDAGNATRYRWDGDDGVVLLAGSAGGGVWDQTVLEVPAPSSAGFTTVRTTQVFGASVAELAEPNPDLASLRVPLAYEAWQFTADGFVSNEAPTTPCADPDACRELGESYLIGHAGPVEAPVGLYFVWGWDWNGAVVAAPLAR